MKLYTVKYRQHGRWFWRTIRNVKGDGYVRESNNMQRFFICADETRVDVPVPGVEFRFSRGRFESILDAANQQAGQKLAVKGT